MRIGVNALFLIPGGVGGTEIYLRSLLAALESVDTVNEYFVFANRETGRDLIPVSPRFHFVPCNVLARFRPWRIVYEQVCLPWRLYAHRIDVVFNPGYTGPLAALCPSVTVFHDLQHKRHPEFFRRHELPFWKLMLWAAVRRSRRLIAVSANTASDLDFYFPGSAAKTCVVRHGVDREFFRTEERKPVEDRYVLTVSTLHPHKNIERLLEAFQVFRESRPSYRLVIIGLRGFAAVTIERRVREPGIADCVVLTGWIPRTDVHKLFANADAFVAPSLFEGFGLPLMEALASGLPSACSDIAVFRELSGDAAIRFDPGSVPAIAGALERITGDAEFRARAAIAGPAQARLFDWNHAATLTLAELARAAGVNPRDR